MALSDEIQDVITRHQIYLMRYSAGREREAAEYIEKIFDAIRSELRNEELTELDLARLQRFFDEIQSYAEENLGELGQKILMDAEDLLSQEMDWNQSMLSGFFENVIPVSDVQAQLAVFAGILYTGAKQVSARNMVNEYRRSKVRQIVQDIRDGVTLREENQQILNRVERAAPFQKKQAGVMIRTLSNHVSVQARDLLLQGNDGLFDGYEWVAVLDSRTSIVCASRDGTVYPLTDDPVKSPKPPAHFNCRSTITPVVKAQFAGTQKRTPRVATGAKGQTKVRQTTTYESWLRRQPAAFQDDVLGKTRGALFRRGKLPISKFVDRRGLTLTLDELRKVEPEVFNRVKL